MPNKTRKKTGKTAVSQPVQPTREPEPAREPMFPIVAVGASAGGIEAFTTLLKHLPDSPDMAFVFVLHQDPHHESNLAQILARATKMPVEVVRAGVVVQPSHVYVSPPNAEMAIERGVLQLHERASGVPSVIDGFFRSLAEDQGNRAISVVLSGSASDGTIGTKAIKEEGGITFAQDDTAKMTSMPHSAIASGIVDFILPPEQIAAELVSIAQNDYLRGDAIQARLPEQDLLKLFGLIRAKHDLDFGHYKPSTVERRIRRRMAVHKVNNLRDYLPIVRNNPGEIESLYGDMLIQVTGFFRDSQVFEALQRKIFPDMMRERREDEAVRVWVPGCATGEEVYSIAIALIESASASSFSCPIQIFGTDVSDAAIERARVGMYSENIRAEVSSERLRRFFNRIDGGYRVAKSVRDCCIFARQNVAKDPPFSRLDLISCRNVMIYFGTGLQRKVITVFHYALRAEGYLLLGSSEAIGNFEDLFDSVDRKNKIYRKRTVAGRPRIDFTMTSPAAHIDVSHFAEDMHPVNVTYREADRVLLERFAPAGVLINENMEVLQFRGRTSRFLEPPSGTASFNLLKMAREGLLFDLRATVVDALKKRTPQRRDGIDVKVNDHRVLVKIEAIPFVTETNEKFVIVLFEEQEPQKKTGGKKKGAAESEKQSARLKRELQSTREYLQSIIEEQEAMNEELRSANEEIQSSNEELQSTNEELETAKEELQSTNEELITLNEELENRNQDLALANNDLVNLLTSVEIPIVMLDNALRIRRFNPSAQRVLKLVQSDVGRPIGDLKSTLVLDSLGEIVSEVIEKLEIRELEVKDLKGHSHSLRIRPYKTIDNRIDGAVLVLLDLEEFAKSSLSSG